MSATSWFWDLFANQEMHGMLFKTSYLNNYYSAIRSNVCNFAKKKTKKKKNVTILFTECRNKSWSKPTFSENYFRSSRLEVFCKKYVLNNFVKSTGKHLRQSLFFNKVTLTQVFPCEFCVISKNTFLTEHLWATVSVISKDIQYFLKIKTEFFSKSKICRWGQDWVLSRLNG